jgi:hypothetical protein
MSNPVTGSPKPAAYEPAASPQAEAREHTMATDRIGVVAREAGLTPAQAQLFRTASESMAADGWNLTDAELRAGAEFAAGRADHITVQQDPHEVIDDTLDDCGNDLGDQPHVRDASAADDDLIARARTAVQVITTHRQDTHHRRTEQARADKLSRWHSNDHANVQQITSELSGPGSSAGAAW